MSNKDRKGVTYASPVLEAEQKVKALQVSEKTSTLVEWQKLTALESDAEYERCTNVLVALKERLKEAESERKAIVDPLNGVVKHVNQKFKPFTAELEKLEQHLKMLIGSYLAEQQAAAMKAAEKEAKKAEKKGAMQLAEDIRENAATSVPVPVNAAVNFRKRWTFKVVDVKAVPREFMEVDEAAVRAAIAAGTRSIKGLEIYEDTIVAVSA